MLENWEDAALKVDDGIHLNWPMLFDKALGLAKSAALTFNDNKLQEKN